MAKSRLLALPLIALLLYLSYLAAGIGIADLYAYSPRQQVEHWQHSNTAPQSEAITTALNSIDQAIDWAPDNGEYRDLKGILLYYRALELTVAGDQRSFTELTSASLASYRIAARLRPRWPYSWANIALMKAALNQFDEEFAQAVDNATRFGPWENAVNISITEAGFVGWHQLSETTRQQVLENTLRGLKRNNNQIKQRLKALNKLTLACIHIPSGPARKKLCGY